MSTTVTRAYLANIVHLSKGYSIAEANDVISFITKEFAEVLKEEGELKLTSFGTFKVSQKKMRTGRNPKTREEVKIVPRKVISFIPSGVLKRRISEVFNK